MDKSKKSKFGSDNSEAAMAPNIWKPGQSGNPKGGKERKGLPHLKTTLKRLLKQKIEMKSPFTDKIETKEISEWIALNLIGAALQRDVKAISIIFDRIDGPVEKMLKFTQTESDDVADFKKRIRASLEFNPERKDEESVSK